MAELVTLWFDVGIKRYTTPSSRKPSLLLLWFDVGIKRYTTYDNIIWFANGCGLM